MGAKTLWGTELYTESASIDQVLIDADKPMTAKEIMAEVIRRGLPARKDAGPHLSTLKRKKHITNENGYWFKVPAAGGAASPTPLPPPDTPPKKPKKKKIANETIVAFYPTVHDIALGKMGRQEGLKKLIEGFKLNPSTASAFIVIFSSMLTGVRYARKNTVFGTRYFLQKISEGFDEATLENAINSVTGHLEYYKTTKKGGPQPAIEKIVARYHRLLKDPKGKVRLAISKASSELIEKGDFNAGLPHEKRTRS
jgi:hypothetical protein